MKHIKLASVLLLSFILFSCENTTTGFIVTNYSSSNTIYVVQITKTSNPNWGDNLLGSGMISAGESQYFYVDSENYDIHIEDQAYYFEFNDVALAENEFLTIHYLGDTAAIDLSSSPERSLNSTSSKIIHASESVPILK